jgi:RNA polymerase sigma-H factor
MDQRGKPEDRPARTLDLSLFEKWRYLAIAISRAYFLPGSEREDVEQEALVGLYIAIRDFVPGMSSFPSFARLCINRHLIACVRNQTAVKHRSMNEARHTEPDAMTDLASPGNDPADIYERKETGLELLRRVREDLTPIERTCLIGMANGLTQEQLSEIVGGHEVRGSRGHRRFRRVDNAMWRAKRKLAA